MLTSDPEKEKDREAGHYEHAYPEDTTIHVTSAPEAQDPSGPALAPGEREDKATRKLIRKIDIRLLPVLAVIYAFALIDRVNLPNARIAGMDEDLGLSVGDRYSLVVMIFFVPYVICQFPANIICRRLGPCLWLPSLAVSWGIVTLGVGFTTSWTQLIACRILLGILESGFYPGCIFLLSCWYCRFEVQKRFSGFYLLALLASGFSNILAWALSLMKGVGGLNGWRWIFIMQGIITVCLGLMGYVFIVDFPDRSTQPQLVTRRPFLTPEEADIVKSRIDRDRGDAVVDSLNFHKVMHHLRDWKLWEWAWLYLLNNVVTYSFGFFLPIILSGDMGYSTTMAQILSFPPYVAAAPWMLSTAWFADRYRKRGLILILNASAAIVGLAMTGFIRSNPAARYAGVFLGVCGCNSNVPTILSYMHNNIVGQTKRSVASALIIGGGAIGGIAASNIFRQADAPQYTPAMITAILTQAVTILHVGKNFVVYALANRKADKGIIVIEGQQGFRYTL